VIFHSESSHKGGSSIHDRYCFAKHCWGKDVTYFVIAHFFLMIFVVIFLSINMKGLIRISKKSAITSDAPLVSICVPARNEERDIGACLESLLAQNYPNFEIIAVDDHSSDRTGEIIQSLADINDRLRFIQGQPLAKGWLGKPFALHQAQSVAKGEFLLFTDADLVFEPLALASAVQLAQERNADLTTLMPATIFGSFWERCIQPVIFGFIASLTRFEKILDKDKHNAMGFGAFLMFKREAYDSIGGHESVRDEILEDVMLAKRVKRSGLNLVVADGKEIFSIRMYHSLKEIWQGWRKNIFIALRKSVFWNIYYIFMILMFVPAPYFLMGANIYLGGEWTLVLSFCSLLLVLATSIGLAIELKLNPLYTLIFPLGAIMMVAIMLDSMFQVVILKRSEWRGRVYQQ